MSSGAISIDTSLDASSPFVVRQKINLSVIIKSPVELTRETRIEYANLPGLVSQGEDDPLRFRREGDLFTYTAELALYPLEEGRHELPGHRVRLVSQDPATSLKSEAWAVSPATTFEVVLPAALQSDDFFVTTASLTVTEEIDLPAGERLSVGDAFERSIYLVVQDVPAMLMPDIVIDDVDGLKIYRHTPEISDVYRPREKVNQTHKEQRLTYIVEKEGAYRLPAMEFVWWNLSEETRIVERIDEHAFQVGVPVESAIEEDTEHSTSTGFKEEHIRLAIVLIGIFFLLIVVLRLLSRYRETLLRWFHQLNQTNRKHLRKRYLESVERRSYAEAVECLYKALSMSARPDLQQILDGQDELRGTLEQLFQLAFAAPDATYSVLDRAKAARLFDAILKAKPSRKSTGRFSFSMSLNE